MSADLFLPGGLPSVLRSIPASELLTDEVRPGRVIGQDVGGDGRRVVGGDIEGEPSDAALSHPQPKGA